MAKRYYSRESFATVQLNQSTYSFARLASTSPARVSLAASAAGYE